MLDMLLHVLSLLGNPLLVLNDSPLLVLAMMRLALKLRLGVFLELLLLWLSLELLLLRRATFKLLWRWLTLKLLRRWRLTLELLLLLLLLLS